MPIEEAVETIATTCTCTACKAKSEPPSDLPEPVQRFMRQAAAFVRNPDAASAAGNVQLIARPGQQLSAVPEPGDILIRIVEGGSGHAAIVASTGLWHGHELRGNGLHPDTDSAEGYVHVTEHAPMRREASEGYARGVTDRGGRLLDDLILLRLMDPSARRQPVAHHHQRSQDDGGPPPRPSRSPHSTRTCRKPTIPPPTSRRKTSSPATTLTPTALPGTAAPRCSSPSSRKSTCARCVPHARSAISRRMSPLPNSAP